MRSTLPRPPPTAAEGDRETCSSPELCLLGLGARLGDDETAHVSSLLIREGRIT